MKQLEEAYQPLASKKLQESEYRAELLVTMPDGSLFDLDLRTPHSRGNYRCGMPRQAARSPVRHSKRPLKKLLREHRGYSARSLRISCENSLWLRIIGDTAFGAISKANFREFVKAIRQLPPEINRGRYAGKTIAGILRMQEADDRTDSRINISQRILHDQANA